MTLKVKRLDIKTDSKLTNQWINIYSYCRMYKEQVNMQYTGHI